MGTYSSAAHCVGMREAGGESNKVKIINLFHASKSQQNSTRRRQKEKERDGEREGVREMSAGNGLIMFERAAAADDVLWLHHHHVPGSGPRTARQG